MERIKIEREQVIAKKNDKVNYWYLVQDGTVTRKTEFSEMKFTKNAIIGMLEQDRYLCDYVAEPGTMLLAFVCNTAEDLKKMLSGQEKIRHIFLRAALEQRHQLLCVYTDLFTKARQYQKFVEEMFQEYRGLCGKYKVEEKAFSKIQHFKPMTLQHKAENWEISNSVSLVKTYMQEYLQLIEKDDALTIGVIMEAAAQMHRFALGIGEMEYYFTYNREILVAENKNDIFELYSNLAVQIHAKKFDIAPVSEKIDMIAQFADKLKVYNAYTISRRLNEYKEYDYSGEGNEAAQMAGAEMDVVSMDCVGYILEYAGYTDVEIDEIHQLITTYGQIQDKYSTDRSIYDLCKRITEKYYEIYQKVFLRAVKDEGSLTPVLEMFLNFGFMDVEYIGEDYVNELLNVCAHLDICQSENIYTMYGWLKAVYEGKKEPSKNNLDMGFAEYLAEQKKNGTITEEQMRAQYQNRELRVKYEIHNMFASVNRATYGKVTSFIPILQEDDIINSVERMLVTVEKLETAVNEVRKVDFGAFYREVGFSDQTKGINYERVMKEVLLDIILMPNAGTKVMMWQEVSTKRNDTSARFMLPVLTAADVNDLMMEAIGRFRWEICRRIQGVHWNDIREKSLTSEYCSYLQFYRKNSDLTAEGKEKVKSALTRAKNNYREVFVKDYMDWIKYESKGGFRVNKVVRDMLVQYCPFVKSIRDELKDNPQYQASLARYDAENAKKLLRYQGIGAKYSDKDDENFQQIKETITYYEM